MGYNFSPGSSLMIWLNKNVPMWLGTLCGLPSTKYAKQLYRYLFFLQFISGMLISLMVLRTTPRFQQMSLVITILFLKDEAENSFFVLLICLGKKSKLFLHQRQKQNFRCTSSQKGNVFHNVVSGPISLRPHSKQYSPLIQY